MIKDGQLALDDVFYINDNERTGSLETLFCKRKGIEGVSVYFHASKGAPCTVHCTEVGVYRCVRA